MIELDAQVLHDRLAPVGASGIRPLPGGFSSLTYAATATIDGTARSVVVKVAPPGLEPARNRDVLRQARLLRHLAGTGVPVPEVLWEDAGAPPDVPPLFVMSFVDGTSVEPLFDDDGGPDRPSDIAGRMHDAVRVLARLHAVDVPPERATALAEEIDRWTRALETVDSTLAPGWEAVADTLRATEPASAPPAILHGDFRLGNTLGQGPRVIAVIDWEIWSVGDPRLDLGWFLINADPETYRRATPYVGTLPSPGELALTYGTDLADLAWFQALACFKSTATWALIVKHGRNPQAAELLPGLLERAARLVGRRL